MYIKENITGFDYLKLALLAFGGVGLELILALIEPIVYGQPLNFQNWTVISHWVLTYIVWGLSIFFIIKYAIKKYGFKLKESDVSPKMWQYLIVAILVTLSLIMSYMSWGGFKVKIEFSKLGILKFSMQYFYYLIETMLFTLIIVFGQKAFEKWFKNKQIPYGGIICALTWGLGHIFTKSSLEVGLLSAIVGFGFGYVYLLLNRDLIKTFPIIFLMFIL